MKFDLVFVYEGCNEKSSKRIHPKKINTTRERQSKPNPCTKCIARAVILKFLFSSLLMWQRWKQKRDFRDKNDSIVEKEFCEKNYYYCRVFWARTFSFFGIVLSYSFTLCSGRKLLHTIETIKIKSSEANRYRRTVAKKTAFQVRSVFCLLLACRKVLHARHFFFALESEHNRIFSH